MVKANNKNFESEWTNKFRLCIIACITAVSGLTLIGSSFAKKPQYESVATVETRIETEEVPTPVHVSPVSEDDLHCLVENAYFEARNQGTAGIIGVIHVTLNRAHDNRFPDNICDVVYQAKTKPSWKTGEPIPLKNQCQFSWYCDGKPDIMNNIKMIDVVKVAVNQAIGLWYNGIDITDGATHYHATYVNPDWNANMKLTTKLGDHKFYRMN